MKKLLIIAIVGALAMSMVSCDKIVKKLKSASGDQTEQEAYVELIEYEEYDEYDGPSDVDMIDIELTEPYHVDMLLDEFDYDINRMAELIPDREGNKAELSYLVDHIIRITEKANEAAEAGVMNEKHLARYKKQTDKFLSIVNNEEPYDGPSDVDLLDIAITETYQVDLLLDNFDGYCEALQAIYEAPVYDSDAAERIADNIEKLETKISKADDDGLMTSRQRDRHLKQAESLMMLTERYMSAQ